MIQDTINTNHTYLEASNYWTPLNDDNDDETDKTDEINVIQHSKHEDNNSSGNKWTR